MNQLWLDEAVTRRPVRSAELARGPSSSLADGIADIHAGRLDVIVVRGAFDAATLAEAGERLDAGAAHGAFGPGFDAESAIGGALGRFAGGRPVELALDDEGRRCAPYALRRLVAGAQIGLTHELSHGLERNRRLARRVETSTLLSYVAMLRAPLAGGELVVYGAAPDDADLPRQPDGQGYDLRAIEQRYERGEFRMQPGDMLLLAAGRCLHRVERVAGAQARITMGGFLALDGARRRVLFWS